MRVAVVLLLVMVTASLMPETEAGWIRRAWRRVKRFVKDHVRVRVTLARAVRSVGDMPANGTEPGVNDTASNSVETELAQHINEVLSKYGCKAIVDSNGDPGFLDQTLIDSIAEKLKKTSDFATVLAETEQEFDEIFMSMLIQECLDRQDGQDGQGGQDQGVH